MECYGIPVSGHSREDGVSVSSAQRYAVWIAHGTTKGTTKCWLCYEPILDVRDLQVDHVIPRQIGSNELGRAVEEFGLPSNFDLDGYENLLPAHGRCNLQKHAHLFRATPLIQLWLEKAKAKAEKARSVEETYRARAETQRAVAKLLNEPLTLDAAEKEQIAQSYASANSTPVMSSTPEGNLGFTIQLYLPPKSVQLAPGVTVVFEQVPEPGGSIFKVRESRPSANS
jgi:5-methylcytosine-specific restriction endonuclease McrA